MMHVTLLRLRLIAGMLTIKISVVFTASDKKNIYMSSLDKFRHYSDANII